MEHADLMWTEGLHAYTCMLTSACVDTESASSQPINHPTVCHSPKLGTCAWVRTAIILMLASMCVHSDKPICGNQAD
jgi:hypothetical protein